MQHKGQGSEATVANTRSSTQNFKIFTFSRRYYAIMLCVSGSKPILLCSSGGPLVFPLLR